MQRSYSEVMDEEGPPDRVPWRQKPRPNLLFADAHPLIYAVLASAGGVFLMLQAIFGRWEGPLHGALVLVGGLALAVAGLTALAFMWLYVERPHDPALDRKR